MAKHMGENLKVDFEQFERNIDLLSILYLDSHGDIQDPFMMIDIMWWFHDGFYDVNLPMKLANSMENVSFVPLGDLMPHLKGNIPQIQHQFSNPCSTMQIESHVWFSFLYEWF
jgi:hypothetical protein